MPYGKVRNFENKTKLIVPVTSSNHSHNIKYFILNEEPKGYICEKGCVHEYPSRYPNNSLEARRDSPISFQKKDTETMKRTSSPVAFKYTPPAKPLISLMKKNSPLFTDPSCSTVISHNKLNRLASPIKLPSFETPISGNNLKRLRSPAKLIPNETSPKSVIRATTQTSEHSDSAGLRLLVVPPPTKQTPRTFRRNERNSSTVIIEEKEYDKYSDVFSRLYPYREKIIEIKNVPASKMDWQNYHRLEIIYQFMEELEALYPSLCTVGIIGYSLEGRDIKILKISNGNANNAAVWIDAGIHAREWIAPAVNTFVANYIARNFDNLPVSCTNKDWYFLPVANPDGYEYSHTNNRMWRKNRALSGGKRVGVDINRNFSVAWGGKGSSDDPNHCFYRGPHPFSEPEACAMRGVLRDAKLPFKVYITLHAYGEVIIFPLAHSDDLCPDYIRLLNGATVMSRAIYDTNGTTYKVGVSKDVMYHASGTSNDWSYSAVGIPYCYLIELRSKKHRFKLPEPDIKDTGMEILNCVKALMEFVDTYPLEQNSGDHKRGPTKDESKTSNDIVVVNIWKEEASTMDVMVEGPRVEQLAGLLHEREIPYTVAMSDVGAMIANERGIGLSKIKSLSSHSAGTMDWTEYHRLETIYTFMENLAREYPYLVTLNVIGKSAEGRNILMMKISNGNTGNTGVWIDGTIHAREWISAAVVTYLANALVRTYHDQPSTVTNKDWYILPVLNPDGYVYTHTHDRMWRKNRAHYGECIGVDLNRNFGFGWGENGEEGSSDDPGNIFYRGPQPFSEPETKAVRNAIMGVDVPFKVFLSLHSYGEVIIFPWGFTTDACPDYVEMLEGATAMAKAIFETSGRVYKVGSTKDLMYYASGTSIDWSYGTLNIPYSYMVELRSKKHKFLLPKDEILSTAQEVWNGILRLMDFVDHRCRSTQSCVCHK